MPKFVMSDGREFTDYSPSCTLNGNLQKQYSVNDTHKYRQFLQHNAQTVMKYLAANQQRSDCVLCPVCKKALESKPAVQ